jgi:DNA-binding transcriptional MerR regulator
MSTYFTIGEISKFFNISIKTLRYYDEIGLLKPAYINKDNNYRYYSVEQFIKIDLIKYFKITGMSLDVIKDILSSKTSIQFILENIKNQSKKLEEKIDELSAVKKYLDNLEKNISQNIEEGIDEVFIKYNNERQYMKYETISKNVEELDINLRPIILEIEKNPNEIYSDLGVTVSYEALIEDNKIIYKEFKVFCEDKININILPKGEYVTIMFEDNSKNSIKYYKKILEYIQKNSINVIGDFHETWIMIKVDEKSQEKSLVKIEILKNE